MRYVLVVCDYATRYPEAIPLKSIDAEHVAEELVVLFSRVGVPKEILTGHQLYLQATHGDLPDASRPPHSHDSVPSPNGWVGRAFQQDAEVNAQEDRSRRGQRLG